MATAESGRCPSESRPIESAWLGRRAARQCATILVRDGVRAADLVKRQFAAGCVELALGYGLQPRGDWSGTVYVVFAADVFSRRIVGSGGQSMHEDDLIMDTLETGFARSRLPCIRRCF